MKSTPGPPMTLGNAATARVRLIVWCKGCQHKVEPDTAALGNQDAGSRTAGAPLWRTSSAFIGAPKTPESGITAITENSRRSSENHGRSTL
jgi:hypothetical protein